MYFTFADGLNTPRVRVDPHWTVSESCTSLAFGDAVNCSPTVIGPVGFTGKPRDELSQLVNFGARYYSSTQGHFLTPDWSKNPQGVPYANFANPQTLNLYSYVGNNPMSLTDPTGHYDCKDTAVCTAVTKWLLGVGKAMHSFEIGSEKYKKLEAVLNFYGSAGDHNGIEILFGRLGGNALALTTPTTSGATIQFDRVKMQKSFEIGAALAGSGDSVDAEFAGAVAHEGGHGIFDQTHSDIGSVDAHWQSEQNAYTLQALVAQGLDVGSSYGLWSPGWVPADGAQIAAGRQVRSIRQWAFQDTASECGHGECQP